MNNISLTFSIELLAKLLALGKIIYKYFFNNQQHIIWMIDSKLNSKNIQNIYLPRSVSISV